MLYTSYGAKIACIVPRMVTKEFVLVYCANNELRNIISERFFVRADTMIMDNDFVNGTMEDA